LSLKNGYQFIFQNIDFSNLKSVNMKKFLLLSGNGFYAGKFKSHGNANSLSLIPALFLILLFSLVSTGVVKALPSYARQTGMSCAACHYSFPELNPFGRQFKMNGYVLTGMKTIDATDDSTQVTRLKLLSTLPLSVMVQSSFTHISRDVPDTQNNSVTLPQQLSVFYAGQVTPHIGTFIQMTYDGHSFGMDNTDIRYTNQAKIGTKNLVYGLTLNNNPAVQDVWNTSPAWRFPSAGSDAAKNPAKSTIMENLGTQVAGLGAYTLFNNLLFAELTLYRSAQQGLANPADLTSQMVIDGVAPYWRLALQHQWSDNYAELGTFGIAPKFFLQGISGKMTSINDIGIDFQFERRLPIGALTLHSSFIAESETRDTSLTQNIKLNFNSFKVDGNLNMKNGFGATLGYFNTSGSEDSNVGGFTNKPNSEGFIAQLEYLPWYNTKFALQYVLYNKFDGSKLNYDHNNRNAADNNTLYLLVWLNF
jgi:hypothetical protein